MKRFALINNWLKLGIIIGLSIAAVTLFTPKPIMAANCAVAAGAANAHEADLTVYTQLSDGTRVNVSYTINDICGSTSIVKTCCDGYTHGFYSSLNRSTSGNGTDVYNCCGGYQLDCRQAATNGTNNGKVAYFSFSNVAVPAGHSSGYWGIPEFSVTNGAMTTVGMTWYDTAPPPPPPPPPPTPKGTIQGRVWRDDNGDGSWNNAEPLIQHGSVNGGVDCPGGGFINSTAYLSISGPISGGAYIDHCNSQPYYTFGNLDPGTYSVQVNAPPGWHTITGAQSATIDSTGNTVDRWFGIQPDIPAPTVTAGCTGNTPNFTASWGSDGTGSGYTVRYNTANDYGTGFWWDPVFAPNTTATLTPPSTTTQNYIASAGTAPPPTALNPGTTYYVDVYYNNANYASNTTSFVALPCQYAMGHIFIDSNGNGNRDAGEPLVGNTTCGGTSASGVSVTVGSVTGTPDQCDPSKNSTQPYFYINSYAGAQTANLNLPAGWVGTNGTTRSFNVTNGSDYDINPWFGIRPAAPATAFKCASGTSSANVSWNNLGLGNTDYNVNVTDDTSDTNIVNGGWYVTTSATSAVVPGGTTAWGTKAGTLSFNAGQTYLINVAYNVSGVAGGVKSVSSSFTAVDCAPPGPPTVDPYCVSAGGPYWAKASWPTGGWQGAGGYEIHINNSSSDDWNSPYWSSGRILPAAAQPYTISTWYTPTSAPAPSAPYTRPPYTGGANPSPSTLSSLTPVGTTYHARVYYYASGNYSSGFYLNADWTFVSGCAPPPKAGPFFTTSGGDVTAGGGIGANCAAVTSGASITNNGGTVDSIVTAINSVSGFTALVLSAPSYRRVCRPDLFARLQPTTGQYYTIHSAQYVSVGTGVPYALAAATLFPVTPAAPDRVYYVNGNTTLSMPSGMSVNSRQTLVVNGDLLITGAASGVSRAAGSYTLANYPNFGVVVSGDIYIDATVKNLYGYYYAGGIVHTCANTTSPFTSVNIFASAANTSTCNKAPANTPLTITGGLFAKDYDFRRTGNGAAFVAGPVKAEVVNTIPDLYVAPPPGFADAYVLPQTEGERAPKF